MFGEIALLERSESGSGGANLAVTASIGLALGALLGRYDGSTLGSTHRTLLVILAFRGVIVTMIDRWTLVLCRRSIGSRYAFLVLLAISLCPTNHQLPFLYRLAQTVPIIYDGKAAQCRKVWGIRSFW
jgi:hypothetical protein